jgi:superfamily II DNA/RNA helicase
VQLNTGGVKALAIHGGKTQAQRDRALASFADGRARALVATDVAARGIHVEDLPCVVHYDPPADHTDYLHRSGRTGRAGKPGIVVSLVAEEQRSANRALQRSLGFETAIHPKASSRSVAPKGATEAASTGSFEPRPIAERDAPHRHAAPGVRARINGSPARRGVRTATPRRAPHRGVARRRPAGAPVGTVRFFDAKKGYGFLSRPDGGGDVFVHASNIHGLGPAILKPGQQVRFEMTTGRKGDEACNVMVI